MWFSDDIVSLLFVKYVFYLHEYGIFNVVTSEECAALHAPMTPVDIPDTTPVYVTTSIPTESSHSVAIGIGVTIAVVVVILGLLLTAYLLRKRMGCLKREVCIKV